MQLCGGHGRTAGGFQSNVSGGFQTQEPLRSISSPAGNLGGLARVPETLRREGESDRGCRAQCPQREGPGGSGRGDTARCHVGSGKWLNLAKSVRLQRSHFALLFLFPLLVRQPLCPRRRPGTAAGTVAGRWWKWAPSAVLESLTYWTLGPALSPGKPPPRGGPGAGAASGLGEAP